MTEVYEFEQCPLRDRAHAVADRSALARLVARALWPAARRAERVELSTDAIEAWTLDGPTRLTFAEITSVRPLRTLVSGRVLRIDGRSGRIEISPTLPGYVDIERSVDVAVAASIRL